MNNLPPKKPSLSTTENPKEKKKHKGRFSSINNFVRCSMRDLPRTEGFVYVALWDFERDGKVQISQSQLAELCGCDVRSVKRALKQLIEKELIDQTFKGNNITGEASIYVLAT